MDAGSRLNLIVIILEYTWESIAVMDAGSRFNVSIGISTNTRIQLPDCSKDISTRGSYYGCIVNTKMGLESSPCIVLYIYTQTCIRTAACVCYCVCIIQKHF